MMDELKPCPFCGGEATVHLICNNLYEVLCSKCDASGTRKNTESEAIIAWNTRYQQPNEPLTLEQVKQMGGEPYYHVSLDENESKWTILPEHIAKNPEGYKYGKTWLAYARKPEGVE